MLSIVAEREFEQIVAGGALHLAKTVKGTVATMQRVGADIKPWERGKGEGWRQGGKRWWIRWAKQKERIKVRARWKVSKWKCMKREKTVSTSRERRWNNDDNSGDCSGQDVAVGITGRRDQT